MALLRQQNCLDQDPPPPKGYSYYAGQREKRVKDRGAYIVGDAAGLATVDLAEGIGPAVESGILAARDILGQADYSAGAILKYSLPLWLRLLGSIGGLDDLTAVTGRRTTAGRFAGRQALLDGQRCLGDRKTSQSRATQFGAASVPRHAARSR